MANNLNQQNQLLTIENSDLKKRVADLETQNRALQAELSARKSSNPLHPITKKVIIAVEGKDDLEFVDAFLTHLNIDPALYEFREVAGKSFFITKIPTLVNKASGFKANVKALIIVRDGDENPKAAFDSLTDLIKNKTNLTAPGNPNEYSTGQPAVGIFIMPGKGQLGALESLALKTVENDPVMPFITKFLEDIEDKQGLDLGNNNEIDKRKAQIFLATRPELV